MELTGEATLHAGLELKSLHVGDQRAYGALLDEAFRLGQEQHFLEDFPVWDLALNPRAQVFGIFRSERLLAGAGLRIAEIRLGKTQVSVALIGGVAVAESERGGGLGAKLVEHAVHHAKQQGAAFVILWGSEHRFYRKLGFELCGEQLLIPLSSLNWDTSPDFPIHEGWIPEIFEQLKTRNSGLVLQNQDLLWYQAHRNVRWYWVGAQACPKAYVALGRGIDLPNMVHEWGGEPQALRSLLKSLEQHHPQAVLLGQQARLRQAGLHFIRGRTGPDVRVEYLCMGCVLNPIALASLASLSDREVARLMTLGSGEQAQAFFGPHAPDSLEGFPQGLPLPFWIWGLDGA